MAKKDSRSRSSRDYAKRLDEALTACMADLKTVEGALLFKIGADVDTLVRITDIPHRRIHAALFLLREHGLAKTEYFADRTLWTRKDPDDVINEA